MTPSLLAYPGWTEITLEGIGLVGFQYARCFFGLSRTFNVSSSLSLQPEMLLLMPHPARASPQRLLISILVDASSLI